MSATLDHFKRLAGDSGKPDAIDPRDIMRECLGILDERGAAYGGMENSFERAAAIASLKLNKVLTPYDVATVLESVKDSRKATNPTHRDSHIDGINYSAFRAAFALKGTSNGKAE